MAKITGICNEIKFTALGSVNDVHSDLSDNSAKKKKKTHLKATTRATTRATTFFTF